MTTPHAVYLCPVRHCPTLWQLALGLLPHLGGDGGRVAIFRPIVAEEDDPLLNALAGLLGDRAEVGWGVTADQALHDQRALAQVVDRYAQLADRHSRVLVLGSEYDCALAPVEFAMNTRVAANIGVPMLLVVGAEAGEEDLRRRAEVALAEATGNLARVLGIVVPGGGAVAVDLPVPVATVVDVPAGSSLDGEPLVAPDGVAALGVGVPLLADMALRNLLPGLRDDSVVIFSADRTDVAVGLSVAAASGRFPTPLGAIAAGPWPLEAGVVALWRATTPRLLLLRSSLPPADVRRRVAESGRAPLRITEAMAAAARTAFGADTARLLLGAAAGVGRDDVVTPAMFEHRLLRAARDADRHIVLPEGEEPRILRAAHRLLALGVCRLTLLGRPATIAATVAELGVDISGASVVDPTTSELRERFAVRYAELRAKKGVTLEQARERVADVSYFGTMMVLEDLADGMVSGSVNTTAHTIRPALEVIKTRPGISVVSSVFLMCLSDRVLVFGDCAVNPNPTPEQVAEIAISSAETARQFGIEPRVAMLSYSTGASGTGPDVESTIEATRLLRERAPQLLVEGPLQYDAAVDPDVARTKLPDSPVAGQATVLIFPDLQTGNNTYKAVQRSAGALAIGPVLQGLNKPVNDLSRGALVSDIVNTVAITAIQAGMQP